MTDRGHSKNNVFAKDAVILSGKFLSYEVNPTLTDTKQVPDKKYVDDLHLSQSNFFCVGKAGSDSNSGLNEDSCLLTISAAISKAIALTPSSSNQFNIRVIDAGVYTEDFTMPQWVNLDARMATLSGVYNVTDDTNLLCKDLIVGSGGSAIGITKSTGTSLAIVDIAGVLYLGANEGLGCTSGVLVVSIGHVTATTGDFISTSTVFGAEIYVRLAGGGNLSNGSLINTTSGGIITLETEGLLQSQGDLITGGNTNLGITIIARDIRSLAGKLYNITASTTLSIICTLFVESIASTSVGAFFTGSIIRYNSFTADNNFTLLKNDFQGIRFKSDSFIETGKFLAYDTSPTFTDGRQLVDKNYVDSAPVGHLEQDQIYYVAKAGNDSNTGKSEDDPFLTIAAAIVAANGDTPAVANQITIRIIDGGSYTENFALASYVHLDAPGAVLTSSITVNDHTNTSIKELIAPSSLDAIIKTSGSGTASVNILSNWTSGIGYGIRCTSGRIDAIGNYIEWTVNFIRPGSTGEINLIFNSANGSSVNSFVNYNTAAQLNIICNEINNTSSANLISSTGSNFITVKSNILKSTNGKIYAILSGVVLDIECADFKEGSASTKTSANANRRITRNDADKTEISNDTVGVLIESSESGVNTEFKNATATVLTHKNGANEFTSHALFEAYLSSNQSNVTGGGTPYTIIFDTEVLDRGGDYNNATGLFTAPITGWYLFTVEVEITDVSTVTHTTIDMRITTTAAAPNSSFVFAFEVPSYSGSYVHTGAFFMPLAATNTAKVDVLVGGSAQTVDVRGVGGNTKWSGMLWGL